MMRMALRTIMALLALGFVTAAPAASARDDGKARAVLEQAAEAMGGLGKLRSLHNVVLTGFGQRVYFQGGGFITGERYAPPKWQAVTDAQRTFDLQHERALNQERRSFEFPFAGLFGLDFARSSAVQTGDQLLDHPLPALLEALDKETELGAVSTEDGAIVVEFMPAGSSSPA